MTIDDQVTVRDDVQRVLSEARDVLGKIEGGVDRINELTVELLLSGSLSEEDEGLADAVGGGANTLFAELGRRFEALRRVVAADPGDDNDEDNTDEG